MPRRKSVLSQLIGVAAQRQRAAQRQAEQQRRTQQRQWEKAQADARKHAEREAKREDARLKQEAALAAKLKLQEEKERQRRVTQAVKDLDRAEREEKAAEAKAVKDKERAEREQKAEEAKVEREKSKAVREAKKEYVEAGKALALSQSTTAKNRLADLAAVLAQRDQSFTSLRGQALEARMAGLDDFEHFVIETFKKSRGNDSSAGEILEVHSHPDLDEVMVDCELPSRDIVPVHLEYKYVASQDEIKPSKRKVADVRREYAELVAQIVLRTVREAFDLIPDKVANTVVINAHQSAIDAGTGKPIRPCVLSVSTDRSAVDELVLDLLDPVVCLKSELRAIVSPNPYDLEPVRPVMAFDLSRYRFTDNEEIVTGLDSRLDLLSLTPTEFEHLIRALVEKMGMEAWVTQSSNDDGIDAVATNPKPMIGGLCIIQAKRYKGIVGPEAVHALAGNVQVHKAARGILMTTSWVSSKTRAYAEEHGRLDVYEGRELKALIMEHLEMDVLISLPKLPRGWMPEEVA